MAQLRLARVAGMGGILLMMRDFYAFERLPLDEGRSRWLEEK